MIHLYSSLDAPPPTRRRARATMGAVASAMACASPTPADASSAVVEVTEVDRAVLELKRTKSALESRARRAREDIARDVSAARANVSSFPIVAKRHLRAKRVREAMVERLHDYALVVERALLELDAALMTSETARALRSGRDALITVTRACEDVDELMRDLEGVGRWFAAAGEDVPVRDDEIEDEYAALARETTERAISGDDADADVVSFPSVPASSIAASREETAEATKESPRRATAVPSPG